MKTKKKDLRRKISGFLVQMRLETKQNEKTRSSPQISGALVSHHNMVSLQIVSLQNGVTRGGLPPPSDATKAAQTALLNMNSKILYFKSFLRLFLI